MGQLLAFPKTMLLSAKEKHSVLADNYLSQPTFFSGVMAFCLIELGTAQCLLRGLNQGPLVPAFNYLYNLGDKEHNPLKTSITCLKRPLSKRPKNVFKANCRLMLVKIIA